MKIQPVYLASPPDVGDPPSRRRFLVLGLLIGGSAGSALAHGTFRTRDLPAAERAPGGPPAGATPADDALLRAALAALAGPDEQLRAQASCVVEAAWRHPGQHRLRSGMARLAQLTTVVAPPATDLDHAETLLRAVLGWFAVHGPEPLSPELQRRLREVTLR